MSPEPLQTRLSPEERVLELERMTKCLAFAADVFTAIGDSFQPSEHAGLVGVAKFSIEQFDPLLKKHNLLCAGYRQQRLLNELSDSATTFGGTTCGVWDFAHSAHHVIFDADLPKE